LHLVGSGGGDLHVAVISNPLVQGEREAIVSASLPTVWRLTAEPSGYGGGSAGHVFSRGDSANGRGWWVAVVRIAARGNKVASDAEPLYPRAMHSYPESLEQFVREHWTDTALKGHRFGLVIEESTPPDPLPSPAILRLLLSTCYQASLMREEDRPVVFRVLLRERARIPREGNPPDGLHRLSFNQPRPFNANELRRLSPAASFDRALVGGELNPQGQLEIWGVVHSGSGWVRAQEGSRTRFDPLPGSLVVVVRGPGRLTVARGSFAVARLQGGRLVPPSINLLETGRQLPEAETALKELEQAHERARSVASRPWAGLAPAFAQQLRQQLALRMVSAIRSSRHGGTILLIGRELAQSPETIDRYVRLKYSFHTDEPRFRARTLILQAMSTLAEVCGETHPPPATVGWSEYASSSHPRVVAVDEAINELARFLAGLTATDGAVVMTNSLELLGFGGEIRGDLPDVEVVARVTNMETGTLDLEPATAFGTRHRSAYRLCRALPTSVALVVSQDSSFRVVACTGDQVTCWEQLTAGVLDL